VNASFKINPPVTVTTAKGRKRVLARTREWVFGPEEPYERTGVEQCEAVGDRLPEVKGSDASIMLAVDPTARDLVVTEPDEPMGRRPAS